MQKQTWYVAIQRGILEFIIFRCILELVIFRCVGVYEADSLLSNLRLTAAL